MFPDQTQHRTDFLIIGAGLAGCLLAWRLKETGASVSLIGDSSRSSSSAVAAGIINPVTGRWMTKSWNIDQLLPEAINLYREIEARLDIQVFHQIPARRFCLNEEDAKRAKRRIRNPRYGDVLTDFIPTGQQDLGIKDAYGSFSIAHTAYVDIPKLLESVRSYFQHTATYIDAAFDYAFLKQENEHWSYQNIQANNVIFCEGAAITQNPWFNYLPLTPIKGETLLLSSEKVDLAPGIYHHEKWILPYGDGTFRIGATYDETDLSEEPTKEAEKQLLEASRAFAENHENAFVAAKQLAGIRPATSDNRPFLGEHPSTKALYIFNGLGSKGASLAPKLSKDFVSHITRGAPLDPEVDIARFNPDDAMG